MRIIIKWLILSVSILAGAYLIPGVKVEGLWTAVILAAVLGVINVIIKPLLILVTLPINLLTLGLFTLVINALIVLLASTIVKGFYIEGFVAAFLFGILLSIFNFILTKITDTLD